MATFTTTKYSIKGTCNGNPGWEVKFYVDSDGYVSGSNKNDANNASMNKDLRKIYSGMYRPPTLDIHVEYKGTGSIKRYYGPVNNGNFVGSLTIVQPDTGGAAGKLAGKLKVESKDKVLTGSDAQAHQRAIDLVNQRAAAARGAGGGLRARLAQQQQAARPQVRQLTLAEQQAAQARMQQQQAAYAQQQAAYAQQQAAQQKAAEEQKAKLMASAPTEDTVKQTLKLGTVWNGKADASSAGAGTLNFQVCFETFNFSDGTLTGWAQAEGGSKDPMGGGVNIGLDESQNWSISAKWSDHESATSGTFSAGQCRGAIEQAGMSFPFLMA